MDTKELEQLKQALKLDDTNWEYFLGLFHSKNSATKSETLTIFEPGQNLVGKLLALSPATASPEMLKHLPYQTYSEIRKHPEYASAAKTAVLWMKKMMAGTGSNIERKVYLGQKQGCPENEVKLGTKATDLFLSFNEKEISVAEVQVLQLILAMKNEAYGGVVFHDIVSFETEKAIQAIWQKPAMVNPAKTYQELISSTPGLERTRGTTQAFLPTIDSEGKLSLKRQAPGGHALFGVEAIAVTLREGEIPHQTGKVTVGAIGNGEDLSSTPDSYLVGWMVTEKIPIAMVTTEKTELDMKGGQIMLIQRPDGSVYTTIVEAAQAKQAGQLPLFEKLGLRPGDRPVLFNTNMSLFNYEVLIPKMRKLASEIGETQFYRLLTPDLIENPKEQRDQDGVVRKYIQLEGAKGSTLLNLDREWRKKYNEPLVHFINIERDSRTDFFSPIKTAFDYVLQFRSDRFVIDPKTGKLINRRPGKLPAVSLTDSATKNKFWAEVKNTADFFTNTSLLDLDELKIEGKVDLSNTVLKGKVEILNNSPKPFVVSQNGKRTVVENVRIEIDSDHHLKQTKV